MSEGTTSWWAQFTMVKLQKVITALYRMHLVICFRSYIVYIPKYFKHQTRSATDTRLSWLQIMTLTFKAFHSFTAAWILCHWSLIDNRSNYTLWYLPSRTWAVEPFPPGTCQQQVICYWQSKICLNKLIRD